MMKYLPSIFAANVSMTKSAIMIIILNNFNEGRHIGFVPLNLRQ
jgi:hypothetical protein